MIPALFPTFAIPPAAINYFLDTYTGTAGTTLAVHNPNFGGAYVNDTGGGSTTDYALDGSGGIPSNNHGSTLFAPVGLAIPSKNFTASKQFVINSVPAPFSLGHFGTILIADDVYNIDTYIEHGSIWTIHVFVNDDDDNTLFDSGFVDITSEMALGSHTLLLVSTIGGTSVLIDSTTVASTSATVQSVPDGILFANYADDNANSVTMRTIRLDG